MGTPKDGMPSQGKQQRPSSSQRQPLDIAYFMLRGEPSQQLLHEISTQKMLNDAYTLSAAHKLLAEAEQQIVTSLRSGTGLLPKSLDLYAMADVAGAIKRLPVQLATLLADTIILAAGQIDTFEKSTRLKAIHGIADGILRQAEKEHSVEKASEQIIRGILAMVEQRGVPLENEWHRVSLSARKRVLKQIADYE